MVAKTDINESLLDEEESIDNSEKSESDNKKTVQDKEEFKKFFSYETLLRLHNENLMMSQ